jgi:MFS family permease
VEGGGIVRLVYAAAGLRSLTIGLTGVALGLFLAVLGLSPARLGVIVALGLAGNAAGTALVALYGDRIGRRRALLVASVLAAAGLAVVAIARRPGLLGLGALVGMVNGMGRDRGPAQTVDQSLLADVASATDRTLLFTRYTFIQDVLGAIGSLAAALPTLLAAHAGLEPVAAYRWTLLGTAVVSLIPVVLYARVPDATGPRPAEAPRLGPDSRRRVAGLVGLFALDSLGGGVLAGSILSYWFFRRYGLDGAALGGVFFAARGLNALSYFVAAALARRFGLIRTMVFTHLPSSLVLLVLPFAATPWLAITLFLARESLVQMDVPARQSYVAAVTAPGERTFALGVTSLARNVGWAVGPGVAGAAMGLVGLGAPLIGGAVLKVVYDLALYASYRHVRVEED